jgi:protein-disulfide isomerase
MRATALALLAALTGAAGVACSASEGARSDAPVSAGTLAGDRTLPAAAGDTALERRADHARIQGSPNAPLWVVEISDFQCPYCKQWHDQSYPAIKREYIETGRVRFAYINFPLSGHRNAWPAAEAAMCAAAQDKFWPMHDGLFDTQNVWGERPDPTPVFDSLATAAGVDTAAYHACVAQHKVRPLIQADLDRATESGVNSTPSFVIGGTMIRGAQPTDVFRQVIDSALAKITKSS